MFFKCARDRSQWSRRPGMIHRLLRAVDKVPCAKHCRWRWPAVSCAAAARSRRAQLALCRRHALDRTGKQSWHAAAEPYTPHGNGLDETSTAAMEAVLRHGKNKSSRSTVVVKNPARRTGLWTTISCVRDRNSRSHAVSQNQLSESVTMAMSFKNR